MKAGTSLLDYKYNKKDEEDKEVIRPYTVLRRLERSYYQDTERFIHVSLKDIKTGPFFGLDLYVKTFIDGESRYVLYYKGKDLFNSERREEFVRRNIDRIYICKNGRERYMRYIEANLQKIMQDEKEDIGVRAKMAYEVGLHIVQGILGGEIWYVAIDRIRDWVFIMIDFILENNHVNSILSKIIENDRNIFRHSVNITVNGLLFARHTGLELNLMNKLGIGLLLHDIGLISLNKSNLASKDDIKNNVNKDILLSHPRLGYSLLEKTKKIAPETLDMIRQHHENVDGTGYPDRLTGHDIHILARYARIVDEYDLLVTREKEKDVESPYFSVVQEMMTGYKGKFDTELMVSFVKFLGPKSNKRWGIE